MPTRLKLKRFSTALHSWEFLFALPLTNLHKGDNPIYIRMTPGRRAHSLVKPGVASGVILRDR